MTSKFRDAALTVLQTSGRAMTVREITAEAMHRGLLDTVGKTPERSMARTLYTLARDENGPIARQYETATMRARPNTVRFSLRQ